MSKPVKELIRKELIKKFEGVTSLAVVGFAGVDGPATHQIRGRLREKQVRVTVVKNSIARQAFDAVGLAQAKELLDGPCAVAFAADPEKVSVVEIVRELLKIAEQTENLEIKAALLDGEVFGSDRVKELSSFPTRDEAVARLASHVLSPGAVLTGCLIGPGAQIAAVLKAIQEDKKQEAGCGGEQAA